jgi:CheY-like chemotaxis protein
MMSAEQLNVLIIDDDPDVRNLLVEIVNRREHQAVAVESAEEGLELLPYWTFQVAFLDQHLPGMEGLLLGEYLRRNNRDMMIALITGQPDKKLERRSEQLSIRFIPKPFKVQNIFDVLDDYVAGAAERAKQRRHQEDDDYCPPIAEYVAELGDCYSVPNVPNRVEERLVQTIKRALNDLHSDSRYTERDRVIALAGLLAAKVLSVDLPKSASGGTLFEEYDELMCAHGRRREFSTDDLQPGCIESEY